jgi:hypothetical protein
MSPSVSSAAEPARKDAPSALLLQRIPDPAIRQLHQPRLRNRWSRGVAAEVLQTIAGLCGNPCSCVQREAVQGCAQRTLPLRLPAAVATYATVALTAALPQRRSEQQAPRGYYMLFVLSSVGIPSDAVWVQLQ